MKDVAALAGVSVSTVSRVISGSIPVDQGTAKRVRDAISSLDFRSNLLASGLRSKSGKLIDLVVAGPYEPFASTIGYLEHTTARHGYNLVVGNSRSREKLEEQFVDHLIRRHVDGIIFTPISHRTQATDHLLNTDLPIVWFDRVWDDERILTVRLDNQQAGELAAQHLCEHGHQRLAPRVCERCSSGRVGGSAATRLRKRLRLRNGRGGCRADARTGTSALCGLGSERSHGDRIDEGIPFAGRERSRGHFHRGDGWDTPHPDGVSGTHDRRAAA